jgi:Na+-driven multidrug efflux pump
VFSWGPPIARALGVPRLEVVGAAWATVLARAVACSVPLVLLWRSLGVSRRQVPFWPTGDTVRRIVSLAWPTSTQFVVRVGAVLLVIALVHHAYTTTDNSDAGTAYALCLRMETMALFVSMGWGGAAQTFVGMPRRRTARPRPPRGLGDRRPTTSPRWPCSPWCLSSGAAPCSASSPTAGPSSRSPTITSAAWGRAYTAFGFAIVLGNALVGAGAARTALRLDASLVLAAQLPLLLVVTALLRQPATSLWNALVIVNLLSAVVYTLVWRKDARWLPAAP